MRTKEEKMVNIQFAKNPNAKELEELDKIANKELKRWMPNKKYDFIRIIKKSKYSIITAKEGSRIIGYLSLRPDKESRWLWVEDVYVLKEYRQKGIAKQLIKRIVNYKNKKMPKRRLVLLTGNRNLNIFEKLGFKKTMNFMELRKR